MVIKGTIVGLNPTINIERLNTKQNDRKKSMELS